jgi:23S rRNA (pseudouridine1915-N3)-methyltransferase
MKWRILTVGKPALTYAKQGVDEYLGRMRRYTDVDWQPVKALPSPAEAKPASGVLLVLDERGESLTTAAFRQQVDQWELQGQKSVVCLIGGADGHSPAMRQAATMILSLSAMTMQHELALVVWLEQLYRVYTLKKGEPYHR